jgi:transposase-like protein
MFSIKEMEQTDMRKPRRQSPQNRWTRDPVKESYRKKQLEQWQNSGLSVRAFCKEHGIVETSFYAWRRELIIRARETGEIDDQLETPNSVKDSRGRTIRVCFIQSDQAPLKEALQKEVTNPFVPLSVPSEPKGESKSKFLEGSGLTITTPSGYQIFVSSLADHIALIGQTHFSGVRPDRFQSVALTAKQMFSQLLCGRVRIDFMIDDLPEHLLIII